MLTMVQIIDLTLYSLIALLYLPVIVNALRGQEGHQPVHYLLGLYALVGLLLAVGEALWRSGLVPNISGKTFQVYQTYAALLLAVLMLLVVSIFLRREGWPWLVVAGLLVVALVLFTQDVFGLPDTIWTSGSWSLPLLWLAMEYVALPMPVLDPKATSCSESVVGNCRLSLSLAVGEAVCTVWAPF